MKYIFIVNPVSGGGKNIGLIDDIETAFAEKGKSDRFVKKYTEYKGHAREIASEYSEKYGKDCIIVACGGDGTVHECANGLAYTETPLAVLPMGSGNDFSAKLYEPKCSPYTVAEELGFLSAAPKMRIRSIDMGKCNGSYFVGVMSMGFDTSVEVYADKISRKIPKAAPLAYKLGLAAALPGKKKFSVNADISVQSTANGRTRRYPIRRRLDFTLIAVCNSGFYGGGFCPSPDAVLNDGLFEMCIASPCSFADICYIAPMYKKGVAAEISRKVKLITVLGGKFTSTDGKPFVINCDGENMVSDCAEFSIEHKSLRLCTSMFR